MTSHGSFGAPGTKKGAEGPIGSACGNWNAGLEWGYYTPQETSMGPDGTSDDYEEPLFGLWRDEFHEGNYNAADHHVCDWVVYDLSCYSGQTPMAIDELDNHGGKATCAQPSIVNCGKHAGWELDIAEGTSLCAAKSTGGESASVASDLSRGIKDASSVEDLGRRLGDAMKKTIEDQAVIKGGGLEANTSYYIDKGYKKDPDPTPPKEHPHGGY